MLGWARGGGPPRTVATTGMHGVIEAVHDREFAGILESTDLVVADGAPVMWMGRLHGHPMKRRVYGPELMLAVTEASAPLGLRHFYYGGAPGVADALAAEMSRRFPGIVVAGTHCPPMAPIAPRENPEVVAAIRAARPDILWVGLSTPKQERWMVTRRDDLGVPVTVSVGAAFDFHTGRVSQAPAWMRERGLEWFYRLCSHPRRLWRRYLLQGGDFALRLGFELATGRWRRSTPR
ncbi:MAG: WecB/TagA/CpsF family glycosyltransferase [Planctomycetia bacterium]|nr:WecB/TagA/CpsF family glycosyltransferase [Planctomycetia bacterium]